MAEHTQQIGMTIRERVEQANLLPGAGTLGSATAYAALENKFVKNLSDAQKLQYGVYYDKEQGKWRLFSDAEAETRVAVTLTDTEVFYFRDFITYLDSVKCVRKSDSALYNTVVGIADALSGGEGE